MDYSATLGQKPLASSRTGLLGWSFAPKLGFWLALACLPFILSVTLCWLRRFGLLAPEQLFFLGQILPEAWQSEIYLSVGLGSPDSLLGQVFWQLARILYPILPNAGLFYEDQACLVVCGFLLSLFLLLPILILGFHRLQTNAQVLIFADRLEHYVDGRKTSCIKWSELVQNQTQLLGVDYVPLRATEGNNAFPDEASEYTPRSKTRDAYRLYQDDTGNGHQSVYLWADMGPDTLPKPFRGFSNTLTLRQAFLQSLLRARPEFHVSDFALQAARLDPGSLADRRWRYRLHILPRRTLGLALAYMTLSGLYLTFTSISLLWLFALCLLWWLSQKLITRLPMLYRDASGRIERMQRAGMAPDRYPAAIQIALQENDWSDWDWNTIKAIHELPEKEQQQLESEIPWRIWDCDDWCAFLSMLNPESYFASLAYAQAEKLEIWRKVWSPEQWAIVLGHRPLWRDHRSLSDLSGTDWVTLLTIQPQFAADCDWSKLDAGDWHDLLFDAPDNISNQNMRPGLIAAIPEEDLALFIDDNVWPDSFWTQWNLQSLDAADWAALAKVAPAEVARRHPEAHSGTAITTDTASTEQGQSAPN